MDGLIQNCALYKQFLTNLDGEQEVGAGRFEQNPPIGVPSEFGRGLELIHTRRTAALVSKKSTPHQ